MQNIRDSACYTIMADECTDKSRWTVRGNSVGSILENYNILNDLWDKCLGTRHKRKDYWCKNPNVSAFWATPM